MYPMLIQPNFVLMTTVPYNIAAMLLSGMLLVNSLNAQQAPAPRIMKQENRMENGKMKVEIWSDVVCPFCYIGKREFESALAQFPHRDSVEVVWRSFELDPRAPQRSELDMYGMLVEKYGGTRTDAQARVDGVVQRGRTVGIDFNMDKAVIGSSFDAHRLLQFAKSRGKGDVMKERLFKAYFTEGAHIADHGTLARLGVDAGLPEKEVKAVLASARFSDEVRADERAAHSAGVRGVPFFLVNGDVQVSGAQQTDDFLRALQQAWAGR
jgi:predicted DsbA family dithiol-disulfide isomerase